MARRKTGWQDNTKVVTARFSLTDANQRRALEILDNYRGYGRSIQSILTTALLASEGEQYPEPTLGDTAAHQIMISVRELGELLLELRQLKNGIVVSSSSTPETELVDDSDYAGSVMDYLKNRRKG